MYTQSTPMSKQPTEDNVQSTKIITQKISFDNVEYTINCVHDFNEE